MAGTLVIRLKGLGDIVHVIPTLAKMRQNFPHSPIGFLCQFPFGEIIPKSLGIKIFQISPHAGFSESLKLIRHIRSHKFEKVMDLFCTPRTAVISLFSGSPYRAGFSYRVRRHAYNHLFIPDDSNKHLSKLFSEFASANGFKGYAELPWLEISQKAQNRQNKFWSELTPRKPVLGLNPHTTYPSKAWPTEHFMKIARLWEAETGGLSLIFHGPGEETKALEITRELGATCSFTHPAQPLHDFLALLQKVDLFLTADTGPMNLAWAMGVPTVALFGPTTRRAVAPVGKQHLTLFHPTLDCLQCHLEVCDHQTCMKDLQPDWVMKRIKAAYPHLFRGTS